MPRTKGEKVAIGLGIAGGITGTVVLVKKLMAVPPVVVCTPGEEKCIGPDWCRCKGDGTGWIVVTPNATQCQVTPGLAILYGCVSDAETGLPIEGVTIEIIEVGLAAQTDVGGLYRITDISPGVYTIRFSHPHYETLEL